MGAVAVLGGIWEIVSAASRARPVAREGEPGDAGLHGGNREAYGTVALGRPFDLSLAQRPCRHGLAVQVWGRLAAGLDRADLLEPRASR
jgi:hypothetical protein